MRNTRKFGLVALLMAGAACFFANYRIDGLAHLRLERRDGASQPPVARTGNTIRIATFNIQVFGENKLAKPDVMRVLAEVMRRFDVIAIQEVRSARQDVLPRFVETINAAGADYDYVIGPRLGRTDSKEQYAFVFNRASVEIDRAGVYTVDDPDDLLHREPLVAEFRVRGPPTESAFTFALINVHTDPDDVAAEIGALDDVFRAVQNDGRREDDVLLVGDLNADDRHLGRLGERSQIACVVSGVPTNTRGTAEYDNIVYHRAATVEFTGRGGVFDLIREFNLTTQQALAISDHFPVWAEFSVFEGGQPGRIASRPPRANP